jgi:hypothetical protein
MLESYFVSKLSSIVLLQLVYDCNAGGMLFFVILHAYLNHKR